MKCCELLIGFCEFIKKGCFGSAQHDISNTIILF